jgi:hypothetical protein
MISRVLQLSQETHETGAKKKKTIGKIINENKGEKSFSASDRFG